MNINGSQIVVLATLAAIAFLGWLGRPRPAPPIRYYVLRVWSGVEIETLGPYVDAATRDREARRVRNEDEDNTCFPLDVHPDGSAAVGAYSGGFMEANPDVVEVAGGQMQWDPDDGTIRHVDDHGNTAELWRPGDELYDRYKGDYFPDHVVTESEEEDDDPH